MAILAAVAHGDLGHEAEVAGHQLVGGLAVAMLAPALGQHEFFLRFQERELPDLLQVTAQVALGGEGRRQSGQIGGSNRHWLPPFQVLLNERLALSFVDC